MSRLIQALSGNWALKLTAFGLAVLLWVALSAERPTDRWLSVPVEVQLRDSGYQMVRAPAPASVEVRFSGSGRDLLELAIQQPVLVLPVPEVQDGNEIYVLDPRMVRLPPGLDVAAQDVRPGVVRLGLAEVATKEVPVRVVVTGRPEGDRVLADSLRVRPRSVRIRGPADLLERVEAVRTRPLDLSVEDSSFARAVPLDTTGLPGVRFGTADVEVSGDVEPAVTKSITDVPVRTAAGLVANPSIIEVLLRGTAAMVAPLDARAFLVGAAAGTLPQPLPPEGLVVPLAIEGVPEGVQVELNPRTVRVFPASPAGVLPPSPL